MRRFHLAILLGTLPLITAPRHAALAAEPADAAALLALPEPPQIDGKADDWPAAPVQKLTGGEGAASFQIAGDTDDFYALVRVTDSSPLKNGAARPEENLKGGDAIALYFGGAPGTEQRVLFSRRNGKNEIFVYRPHSRTKRPYTFSSPVGDATFDYVAPLAGARVAFLAGGSGYIAEIAIPWKSLGLAARPASFPFEVQVIFSDPAGTTNASMAWWHAKGGPGDTIEDLPSEARLYPETWGVAALPGLIDAGAVPVSRAMPGVPIRVDLPRAGRLSLNITDATGWIVRELVVAEKQDKGPHTFQWDGRDRYGEVLPPGQYGWKALLFDGMGAKFMGSVGNSGRPPYRTPDGLGSMGGQHGVPGALAADDGGVYMGSGAEEGQPAFRKIDARTGAALWKRSAGGFGAVLAVATGDGMAAILNESGGRTERPVDLVRIDPRTGQDVKMGNERTSVSRLRLNIPPRPPKKARDAEGGEAEDFTGARIGGMAIAGKRAYFSVPGENRIGGVNLETGAPLPDTAVSAPYGLARLDAENLLVCSRAGVLKLNLATGKTAPLLTGLQAPCAVDRDAAGNLYVSDLDGSQQIKKFSAAGVPLGAWGRNGGKPFNMKAYDPMAFDNVRALAIGPDGNLWLSEASAMPKRFVKLSAAGKWLEDFYGPVAYNTFGPDLDAPSVVYYNPGGNQGGAQIIETKLDYARYAANPNEPAEGWHITAVYDLGRAADGRTLNPVMAEVARTGYGHYYVFTAANGHKYLFRPSKQNRAAAPQGAGLWVWDNVKWVPAAFLSRDDTKEASWFDANGDGLMQDAERYTGLPTNEFAWIERDLTLDGKEGKLSAAATDTRGVPTYAKGKFSPYLKAGEPNYQGGWTFFSPEYKGAVYYVANAGADRHLAFWDRASDNRLIKVEGGKVQWLIGTHTPQATFTTWDTVTGVAGIVDDLVLVHTVSPYYYAVTTDGFNLGNVLTDANGVAPPVGPIAINIESFTGLFAKDPKTGKNMLFSVSSGDDRILEVTGPGQMTRLGGDITLDTPRPRAAQNGETTIIPYETWLGNGARFMAIDGEDYEWQQQLEGIPIYAGKALIGDVRLRRDAGGLYVLADVLDPGALQNGAAVELQLAPRGGAARKLVLTVKRNAAGAWKGAGTLEGGSAEAARQIKVAAVSRWRDLGYRLETEIPLSLLPEVSAPREQKFRREALNPATGKNSAVAIKTETLPDLAGPLQLSATIVRTENGTPARYSWPATGLGTALAP